MADWKIGLRADSYFSGVSINDVPDNTDKVKQSISEKCKGRFIVKEWPTKTASVQTIRAHIQKLEQTKDFKPDVVLVDYADLLRASRGYGEKRHELEGNYEELRGLSQEFNCVMVTADQTNRGGMNEELVTLTAIAESYAKATVCDLIMTVSRTVADKENGTGRLFIAKSRLGEDGVVFPFLFRPATVKVDVLDKSVNPVEAMLSNPEQAKKTMAERFMKMQSGSMPSAASR
jgi:replicative DNA helicase